MLDVWPPFPLIIAPVSYHDNHRIENVDNIVAVLERRNRVCQIRIGDTSGLDLKKVLALEAMQEPFPELTALIILKSDRKTMAVIPDSFLGGSASRLRILELLGIPFPGLPKLLMSATHLTDLRLEDISRSGYISPEGWQLPSPR